MGFADRNRGPRSGDEQLFGPNQLSRFTAAANDYGYLQTMGYGQRTTSAVVGDRYGLTARQRIALQRIGAGNQEIEHRKERALPFVRLQGTSLVIDGFNLLITLESALSGAYILRCRDGAYRDMASISGSYKRVRQTTTAIHAVAETLKEANAAEIIWLLDAPVSNSGRLAALIRETGRKAHIDWTVNLVPDPDRTIIDRPGAVAVSSDSRIMDEASAWCNLTALILPRWPEAKIFAP